jgi:hypothetical protein
MATTSTRDKNPRATRQPLTTILWQDALLEWGIPAILIAVIVCFALLGAFEQIAHTTGVLALGRSAAACWVPAVQTNPHWPRRRTRHKPFLGLAFVWIALTCVTYFAIFVGEEITTGAVATDSRHRLAPRRGGQCKDSRSKGISRPQLEKVDERRICPALRKMDKKFRSSPGISPKPWLVNASVVAAAR